MTWLHVFKKHDYFKLQRYIECSVLLLHYIVSLGKHKILEVGSGSGLNSIVLAELGKDLTGLDVDKKLVSYIKERADLFRVSMNLVCASVLQLPFKDNAFDICFSQGVLEHFQDTEIVEALKEQKRVAEFLVFEVPSEKWPKAESSTFIYGNERFLRHKDWKNLIREANLTVADSYGWGFLPKYKKLQLLLPPFLWNRLTPRLSNILGFIAKRRNNTKSKV